MTSEATHKMHTLDSYDSTATEYARNTSSLCPAKQLALFANMLPQQAHILDLGCGPGRDAKMFADLGFQVMGIDFSEAMIAIAKQNVPQADFRVMDIETIDSMMRCFDGIWASASLLHISKKNIPDLFKNIYLHLQPNGIFYLSLKAGKGEIFAQDLRYGSVKKFWSFFEQEEIIALLTEAQFEIIECDVQEKSSPYHTHAMLYILCKKMSG